MRCTTLRIGAGIGLVANLFFYGKLVGLSFPLFSGISAMIVLASSHLTGQIIQIRNLWLLLPMLFFAIMVAVRTDELITGLNVAASLCLGALALFRLRESVFSLGVLLVLIGFLVTLNLMNVEGYIADRNIDRFESGASLDIAWRRSAAANPYYHPSGSLPESCWRSICEGMKQKGAT